MAGPTTRKNKANDDAPSSPAKRIRQSSPSERSSSTTPTSDGASASHSKQDNSNTLEPLSSDDAMEIPEYVPEDARARLERLRVFCEPEFNRYSLCNIPSDADWGRGPHGRWSHLESLLCYKNKPLVVWMVGVARWTNLEDDQKFTIGVRLLCKEDSDAAIRNSYGRCEPEQNPKEEGTLTYANKWVDHKGRGSAQLFPNVYGAVDGELKGWDAGQKIPASTVQPSDLVVVEFYIRRFKNKTANVGCGWSAWGVNFDLLRIAQLFVGPGHIEELPPASAALI